MDGKELRNTARRSQDRILESRKNKVYEEYHEYINKAHQFTQQHVDEFISFMSDQVSHKANQGEEIAKIKQSSQVRDMVTLGKIIGGNENWEYFFQSVNNSYLVDWANYNEIFVTVRQKRKHYSDPVFSPIEYGRQNDIFYEWQITIDFKKHTGLYKLIRKLRSGNPYYMFKINNNKSKEIVLKRKVKKMGIKI